MRLILSRISLFNTQQNMLQLNIPSTAWLRANNNKWIETDDSGVTEEDINAFRVGDFANASEKLKEKWYMVMLDLLPVVCTKYTKAVKESALARDFTTASDETLVLWHLLLYGPSWEKMVKEVKDEKKKGKLVGEHFTRTEMDRFYDIYVKVVEARSNPATGEDWDEAIREEANLRGFGKGKRSSNAVNEFSEKKKRTYDIKFSPGKKMRVEKR